MAPQHRNSLPRTSPLPPGSYDPSVHRLRPRDSYDTYASGQAPLLHRRPDSFTSEAHDRRRMSAQSGGALADLDPSAHYRTSAYSGPSTVDPLAYYTDSSAAQDESRNTIASAAEAAYASQQLYADPYSNAPRPTFHLAAQPSAEQLQQWQVDTQRRRERESMPAGGITLNGWIADDGSSVADSSGLIHQEQYETHWQSDQHYHDAGHAVPAPDQPVPAASYQIEEVDPRSGSASYDAGRKKRSSPVKIKPDVELTSMLRDASTLGIEMSRMDIPPVRVIAATPSDQSIASEMHDSRSHGAMNTSRATNAAPDESFANSSTAAALPRRTRRGRTNKKPHGPLEASLGIAASKGIASTVRSFWESVGEVQPPSRRRRQEPSSSGTAPSVPRRTRPPPTMAPNASFAPGGGSFAQPPRRDATEELSGILDRTFGLDVDEIPVDTSNAFSMSFAPDDASQSFADDRSNYGNSGRYFDRSFSAADASFGGWR
ncbi:hypothetical protein HDU87_007415 [Geranomyces variabilis]|uniref:Uncharacterized protein n=1 Tax=Geranomyces variabilis TaxID=109894 RepID=A0AAD5TPC4_9FUNG|nr:hypothetical protein HDU87_007415 [Geranomyces variabilis]